MRSISSKILGTILTTTLLVWTGTNAIADDAIPTYTISTIAGVGAYGKDGDGGPALEAKMNRPTSVAVDSKGYIYIADSLNRLVRMVDTMGIISTVVGSGKGRPQGEDHKALETNLAQPYGIAVDDQDVLYVLNRGHSRLLRVKGKGKARTIAGTGTRGYNGDGIKATKAQISGSNHLVFDGDGLAVIADSANHRIRRISKKGIIETIGGTGEGGYSGDGGPAVDAMMQHPSAIDMDSEGNIYIADFNNHRIRKIDARGIISTVAGTGTPEYNGDGIPAIEANIGEPTGVAVDHLGHVFISDQVNNRIRVVTPDGLIHTIAGNGTRGYSGDGGPSHEALINIPDILTTDAKGDIIFPDHQNFVVRKLTRLGTR